MSNTGSSHASRVIVNGLPASLSRARAALRHNRARDILALFAIVAIWLLFFWRLFTPVEADRVQLAPGDFTQQFLVFRQFGYGELRQGRWPTWLPCVDSGYPYVADPQSASFYPPALLNFGLQALSGARDFSLQALQLEAALHVLLAALLAYGFLRGEVRGRTAASIGALVFAFGGYLTGYPVLQLAILESAVWLPLALWAARRLARRGDARSVALLALPLALSILAGHPQTYTFVIYLTAIYFVYRAWRNHLGWRKTIIGLGGAIALAVSLSAVQLIPSLEFARISTRADLPYVNAGAGFPLSDIVQFLVPGVVSHFNSLYVGILPLTLAIFAAGTYVTQRNSRQDVPFWVSVALIGLLISFGSNLALFDGLYWLVPGYRVFRDQERHALIVNWALAVLTAYGADLLLHSLSRRTRIWLRLELRGLIGILILLGVSVVLLVYLTSLGADRNWADRVTLAAIGLAFSIGWLAFRSKGGARSNALAVALIVIVGLDLATTNRAVNWTAPYDPFPSQPPLEAIQADAQSGAIFRLHSEQRLPGHAACAAGSNEVGGITPIRVAPYADFLQNVPRDVRWQLLNVRYLVTWRASVDDHFAQPVNVTRLAQQGDGKDATYTYRLNQDHPRAWIVHEVETRPDRQSIYAALAAPDFDPRRVAYTQSPVSAVTSQATEPVSVSIPDPQHVDVEADLATPGLLILSEVNYPGWMANVNGAAVPIVEVNGLLRGIALPAGQAQVEMIFRPPSLVAGGILTFAGWIVWLVLIIWGKPPTRV